MKKKPYLLLSLLSLLAIIFCSIIKNSNPVSAVTISGETGIVKGVSALQFNGNYGNGHALFNVNLVCADNVSCTTLNPSSWSCWLPTAGNTLGPSDIGEIHVGNCSTDNTTKTCDVWLIPSIDYTTQLSQYQPSNTSKVKNGYAGARAYGQDVDTCNTTRKGDSTRCWGQQSVKGQVSVPSAPPCTANYVEEARLTGSREITTDYYLNINNLKYGTSNTISCAPATSQGPYKARTTVNDYDVYKVDQNHCGGADEYVRSYSEKGATTYETASVNPPQSICNGQYRYHHSDIGLGPFTMNQNVTVNLYYEQIHYLTVTPRRIVNNSSMCGQGAWVKSYFQTDANTSATITPTSPISCNTGTYDFYQFNNNNNVTTSGQTVHPTNTNSDSSSTATYRRRNTLTLKHVNFYNKSGPYITGDQSATVHDYENATINPVSNNFTYGGYEYQLYGYASSRNDTVIPSTSTSYTESNMTSDVTRWAFYKKVLYLTIIPVDTKGNRLANNLVARVLEGDSAKVKTYTTIGNYTFKGFGGDWRNPAFPNTYIYTVPEMHNHVNIYAVYETSDDLSTDCPPTSGNLVQSYVRNTRFDSTTWNKNLTYAKLGDTISYCTGYNNKYPYWNFMYPDYDYLISYGSYANPGRALPLGYRGVNALNSQLYTSFSVTSNRSSLQYANNKQLSFTQNRSSQQDNFKSTKRSTIKDYPTKINDNKADVGLSTGIYEQGHINAISTDTSTSYIGDQNKSTPFTITSLPRKKIDADSNTTARAIFPYNFKNTTTIDNKGSNYYVYSGGMDTLSVNLIVNPKSNAATHTEIGGNYATIEAGDIYYRIEVSVSDNSIPTTVTNPIRYSNNGSNPINSGNKTAGDSAKVNKQIYIPDVNPGTYVCFRSSVWPKDSDKDDTGTSTNVNGGYTSINEAGSWSDWGPQVCYKAASKANLQAWGGNIVANGQINTSYVNKYHLYPNPYYPLGSYSEAHYFGSWGELGIIANQNTLHMASGSALAYPNGLKTSSTNNNAFMSNFVPLTFANYDPLTGNIIFGNLNKSYTTGEQTFDKNALVSKYIYNTSANIGNSISLNQDTVNRDINNPNIYHSDNNVYYYRSDSNLTIGTSNLVRNATQVIHTKNKNIRISGNITYEDGYTTLENIPKLIIYAEDGTISIDWQVARIDAILIADTIITCSKESGCTLPAEAPKANDGSSVLITNSNNRHQLTINGTLIAKKVIPNRTYGAGRGANNTYNDGTINSITPAEIINYDSSLYRWEQYSRQSNEGISPDASLITTYIKEVAPRY
ncbi:hypothetical protein IKE87_02675 [Candidatus Saccharibacteria bacterium]|nr:hypothetical protein [Candidatus Saccharibacteria bacterium]